MVAVRLADDRRGRIPFAVLGALLLLTTTMYTSSIGAPERSSPVAPELVDQAQTEARMALSAAIRSAGRRAAAHPVLDPASTRMAGLLSEETPYRSYLRLLVALAARENLRTVGTRSDGVTIQVSLEPIRSLADARRAMANVSITPIDRRKFRVNLTNITVTVRHDGTTTDEFRYDVSLVAPIPALQLHARVNAYEKRLNSGLLKPGLDQGLTARLFAVTWARGLAQYGGAPIGNVLANRHIELMTNDALLAQQREVFGRVDNQSARALRRASLNVAYRDGAAGAKGMLEQALGSVSGDPEAAPSETRPIRLPSGANRRHSYHVDRTADQAFRSFVSGNGRTPFNRTLEAVYTARVRARMHARQVHRDVDRAGVRPREVLWHFTTRHTTRRLRTGSWSSPRQHGRTLRSFHGTVVVKHTRRHHWVTNGSHIHTSRTRTVTYRVRIDLQCGYRGSRYAPSKPAGACPFPDEMRQQLPRRATRAVRNHLGGPGALARRATRGRRRSRWLSIQFEPPDRVRRRAYRQVAALHGRVREVSVTARPRSIASAANPASMLAAELGARRAELLDAPRRYRSLSGLAAGATKAAYLDRVRSALRGRSTLLDRLQQELVGTLQEHAVPTRRPSVDRAKRSSIATAVESRPLYLSLVSADGKGTPALAARNINLFAIPYGDAADTVTRAIVGGGPETVSLSVAARTLSALEAVPQADETPRLRRRREHLRDALRDSLREARARYERAIPERYGRARARRAIRRAFRSRGSLAERAAALADGSIATGIANRLAGSVGERRHDLLAVTLRVETSRLRESTAIRVDEGVVAAARQSSASVVRETTAAAFHTASMEAVDLASKRVRGKRAVGLPAGLPITPVPGYWYATANAWHVSVRGRYDSFSVSAANATPSGERDGTLTYTRQKQLVSLDVDGDGMDDPIGWNRPITFTLETGVFVVVPPGWPGVGDVDGNADERSPGWGEVVQQEEDTGTQRDTHVDGGYR
ncbi:MAG: hypothetical protein ABEI31_05180 [Halodesulfurarchaeum sp.]